MATVTRLHICPYGLDRFSFNDHFRTGQRIQLGPGFGGSILTGRNGFRLKKCRAYRCEDGGGDLKEKEIESARKCGKVKESLQLKKGSGFWSSLKYAVTVGLGLGSRNDDEYTKAIAKLEEVFSSVSSIYCYLCFIKIFYFCELNQF